MHALPHDEVSDGDDGIGDAANVLSEDFMRTAPRIGAIRFRVSGDPFTSNRPIESKPPAKAALRTVAQG